MTADLAPSAEWDDLLREMQRLLHSLDTREPADLRRLLAAPGLAPDIRRAAEALFALQAADRGQRSAPELPQGLTHDVQTREPDAPEVTVGGMHLGVKPAGTARKVSVSMPEDLTAAVQRRAGRGKFSQYVTEAVTRQLELDLLAELSELLEDEYGPIPEDFLAEARAAWPDGK
jgi:Arc/MetJ-type ribon-helix-helix transcriptional regulator